MVVQPSASSATVSRLYVGTSGWAYPSWKPGFYPAALPAKKFLGYYATRLNSCEVNYTFRKLPTAAQIADWLAQTGEGFRFSFKAPQRITHFSRLREELGVEQTADEGMQALFEYPTVAAFAAILRARKTRS